MLNCMYGASAAAAAVLVTRAGLGRMDLRWTDKSTSPSLCHLTNSVFLVDTTETETETHKAFTLLQ